VNYNHAFHAGSFADVFKHAVLCLILQHLRGKDAAFRVIDTHAGAGVYDLTGPEASRGGEWKSGVAKLLEAKLPKDVAALLKPYLDVVGALNESGRLTAYPGSPAFVRAWLRPQDRLIACELEPKAFAALKEAMQRDNRIKCLEMDGWTALKAYLPPKERRGLVLVDPLVSICLGIVLYGDSLRTSGWYGPLEALSLLVMFMGAVFLSNSPLITGMKGEGKGVEYDEMLSRRLKSHAPA